MKNPRFAMPGVFAFYLLQHAQYWALSYNYSPRASQLCWKVSRSVSFMR
jgi:hypothetical protein